MRDDVNKLITSLKKIEDEFLVMDIDSRKEYYYKKREEFNQIINSCEYSVEKSALFIFLNRTCFNGLYRVNKNGLFNVPMGNYKNPCICDEKLLKTISKALKKVIIKCEDYKKSFSFADENTLFYFDPPYRPINNTSSFNSYTEYGFDDKMQIELSEFIKMIDKRNVKFILSNSDPKNNNENDNFFDDLYSEFNILRIGAKRAINSNAKARGVINELLIKNI